MALSSDKRRFAEALRDGAFYEKTYHARGLAVTLCTPRKADMDRVISYLDDVQKTASQPRLLRLSRTLQIRLYVRKITTEENTREFLPIGEVLEKEENMEKLVKGLHFANENLYLILHKAAETFKDHVDELTEEMLETDRLSQFIRQERQPGDVMSSDSESKKDTKQCDKVISPPDTSGDSTLKNTRDTSGPSKSICTICPEAQGEDSDYSSERGDGKKLQA